METRPTYIYAIGSIPRGWVDTSFIAIPIKIGFSADPEKRVTQLQPGNADQLEVLLKYLVRDGRKAEVYLHKHFARKRRHREWFYLTYKELEEGFGILFRTAMALERPMDLRSQRMRLAMLIQLRRKRLNLTQTDLADLLHILPEDVERLERGQITKHYLNTVIFDLVTILLTDQDL